MQNKRILIFSLCFAMMGCCSLRGSKKKTMTKNLAKGFETRLSKKEKNIIFIQRALKDYIKYEDFFTFKGFPETDSTVLTFFAYKVSPNGVNEILKQGKSKIDINATDKDGKTALHFLVQSTNENNIEDAKKIAKKLIDEEIDYNAETQMEKKDKTRYSAAAWAQKTKKTEFASYLQNLINEKLLKKQELLKEKKEHAIQEFAQALVELKVEKK